MSVFTLHAFPGFSNPKVWRIALDTNIILCKVRSLNGAFTFSLFHIINKGLGTRLALETDIVPKVWTIAWYTDIVLSIGFVWGALTFFCQRVVNLFWWAYDTNHSSFVVVWVLWASVAFMIFKHWGWLWTWFAHSSQSVIDLLVWTLKASSLACIPVTWLNTLHTFNPRIKR